AQLLAASTFNWRQLHGTRGGHRSTVTGAEFFITPAGLTPTQADTLRSGLSSPCGLRRPCGLERPQRVDTHCGSRGPSGSRHLSGPGGSTITADGIGSTLPSHDHEDPP